MDTIKYGLIYSNLMKLIVMDVVKTLASAPTGTYHFCIVISFDTRSYGVVLSDRLKAQYPREMTIILQHQFRDLKVSYEAISVTLSFNGMNENISIPFPSLVRFEDKVAGFSVDFDKLLSVQNIPQTELFGEKESELDKYQNITHRIEDNVLVLDGRDIFSRSR
ncbi:ClpXP protease specificity-enhancing factor SspB [Candidatus Fokinia crypta]|uniref:Stringent starvation protein B n=1 Tax=Candidatus Fokinia crypta TaxID=1920990 RepID=A0ABZ0UPI0_9RICK|nr:ClpXP protease specificity-enhancing factor SspB [Candidatus Fokinia cryptica]WPX98036.1 Putative stringent starvation protein B [Candidatus Fokinia cryptica]